jgi:hypothetical protein
MVDAVQKQRYWSLEIVASLCALRRLTSCLLPNLSRETSGEIFDRAKGGVNTEC